MPFDIASIATDAVSGAVNAGLGLILQKQQDERQLKQQGELLQQQLGINKQQMQFGKELDYDLWKKTSYAGQVEQMKAAGLSPGLAYGQAGGGGATTGGGTGGVGAANAPTGGGEIMGLQLMGAQKRLLEAQAQKTEAEAAKTAGVDTELTAANTRIARIEGQMKSDTYEETFSRIRAEAQKAEEEWRKAAAEGIVSEETIRTRIEAAKADLAGIGIANELRRAQKDLTDEQIKQTVNSVAQRWEEIGVQKGRLELEKWVRDVSDSTRLTVETVSRIANTVIGKGRNDQGPKTTEERGWSERYGEWWKTTEK